MPSIKVEFGSLPVGAQFSLSPDMSSPYTNIKVEPSVKIGEEGFPPFNVIALDGGRPRTFHDHEMVYTRPYVDMSGNRIDPKNSII